MVALPGIASTASTVSPSIVFRIALLAVPFPAVMLSVVAHGLGNTDIVEGDGSTSVCPDSVPFNGPSKSVVVAIQDLHRQFRLLHNYPAELWQKLRLGIPFGSVLRLIVAHNSCHRQQ